MNRPLRRVGVIGDVHAEDALLEQALEGFAQRGVDAVLCTGDIADGPGDLARCCALLEEAEVHCVRGNHDRWLLTDRARRVPDAHRREDLDERALAFLEALPVERTLQTCEGPVRLCHGIAGNDLAKVWPGSERMDAERSETLDALIAEGELRWLVNGHMHYRMLLDFETLTLINAGTLAARYRPPGVTLLDFEAGSASFLRFSDRCLETEAEHALRDHDRRVFADTQAFDGNWRVFRVEPEPTPARQ